MSRRSKLRALAGALMFALYFWFFFLRHWSSAPKPPAALPRQMTEQAMAAAQPPFGNQSIEQRSTDPSPAGIRSDEKIRDPALEGRDVQAPPKVHDSQPDGFCPVDRH